MTTTGTAKKKEAAEPKAKAKKWPESKIMFRLILNKAEDMDFPDSVIYGWDWIEVIAIEPHSVTLINPYTQVCEGSEEAKKQASKNPKNRWFVDSWYLCRIPDGSLQHMGSAELWFQVHEVGEYHVDGEDVKMTRRYARSQNAKLKELCKDTAAN